MSQEISGAAASGNSDGAQRAILLAFGVAAGAICLGGAAAILAVGLGASAALSLSLMAAAVACGGCMAVLVAQRASRPRRPSGADALLERELTARYGVKVERVAWHVWRVDGELVEATLNPDTGYLMSGGRELQL